MAKRSIESSGKGNCSNYNLENTAKNICSPYFSNPASKKAKRNLSPADNLSDKITDEPSYTKLEDDFFDQPCLDLAKSLLGRLLVRNIEGQRVSGYIVETECYLGNDDKASHSFNGKRTPRNEPMYMKPGTSYVYPIYGMYFCFNISSKELGSCVLIRALQSHEGSEIMNKKRSLKQKKEKILKFKELCNGPSKLCQSLDITKDLCNKIYLPTSKEFWLEMGVQNNIDLSKIIICKRIGIESAGEEWSNKPLRFYIHKNCCVSVKDKKAEELFNK